MAPLSDNSPKIYLEKEVQTDAYKPLHGPAFSQSLLGPLRSPSYPISTNDAQDLSPDEFNRPASPYPTSSKRQYNLGHNIALLDASKMQTRVVSLPEPVLPEDAKVYVEQKTRVVSMPESNLGLILQRGTHFQDEETSAQRKRPYPLDLPQTPSPPSSPDSVVIIGNETHVPGLILRPFEEGNGWISWAHSPPRPIPALHGPLSLPYARCPSGAEGTVVEGDDLNQKVWGLGPDGSQAHTRSTAVRSPPTSTQRLNAHSEYTNIPLPPAPQPYESISALCTSPHVVEASRFASISGGAGFIQSRLHPMDDHIAYYANISKRSTQRATPQGATGLGLDWQALTTPSSNLPEQYLQSQVANRPGLNSEAPVFVPTYSANNPNAYSPGLAQRSRPTIQQGASSLQSHAFASIQDSPSVMTTPSTASTHWSPMFSSSSIVLDAIDPYIYSPRSDVDGYSAQLLALLQRMGPQERYEFMQDHLPTLQLSQLQLSAAIAEKIQDHSLIHQSPQTQAALTMSLPVGRDISNKHEAATVHDEDPPQTVSDIGPYAMAYQQPRSIPLAKLIQRRLSSVTEEEVAHFTNRLSQHGQRPPLPSSSGQSESDVSEAGRRATSNSRLSTHHHGAGCFEKTSHRRQDNCAAVDLGKENEQEKARIGGQPRHKSGNNKLRLGNTSAEYHTRSRRQ